MVLFQSFEFSAEVPDVGLFSKRTSPELEEAIDSLSRSYMRGFARDRGEIVEEIAAIATRLRSEGHQAQIARARSYRPGFFAGLPVPAQKQVAEYLDHALG